MGSTTGMMITATMDEEMPVAVIDVYRTYEQQTVWWVVISFT